MAVLGNPYPAAEAQWQRLMAAPDLQQSATYLDAGGADERIQTITYASASLNLSFTETLSYAGSAGNYRWTGTVRAQN